MVSVKGLVGSLQGYSTKDGPGIRTTVFCVDCNLRCKWCSNPELMLPGKKTMHFTLGGEERTQEVGEEWDSAQLAAWLARDRTFYEESGGGVTFSGGEAALQEDFVADTAERLLAMGISSALDTAGDVPWETLDLLSDRMEYVLYDVKAFDEEMHRRCTGRSNVRILANLEKLAAKGQRLIIRMVIVPGYNDDLIDVQKRMEFVKKLGDAVECVDILPYHNLGKGKYQRLGIPYPIEGDGTILPAYWNRLRVIAGEVGLNVKIALE